MLWFIGHKRQVQRFWAPQFSQLPLWAGLMVPQEQVQEEAWL